MEFGVQVAAFLVGILVTVSVGIVINAYRDSKPRRFRGDQTGGDVVGRNRMGTFNISGRTFRGNNISISNNRIVIDGKDVTDEYDIKPVGILEITVLEGTIGSLTADGSVSCNDVTGDVSAGGSVKAGDIKGSVNAGGSVKCGSIGGSINAGGSVKHG